MPISHDRRRVALLASTVLWLTTGLFALQAWLQLGNVRILYLLIALQSAALAINQPARSAMIPMLVRKELLPAANALSMVSFGLAMTVGPLLAGVLVAWRGWQTRSAQSSAAPSCRQRLRTICGAGCRAYSLWWWPEAEGE